MSWAVGSTCISAYLIICTMCDEEPCILPGNSADASLSGALGNRSPSPAQPSPPPFLHPHPPPPHPILFLAVVPLHLCGLFPSLHPTPSSLLFFPPRFIFPPLCLRRRLSASSSPNSVPLLLFTTSPLPPDETRAHACGNASARSDIADKNGLFSKNGPRHATPPPPGDTKVASSNQFVCRWVTLRRQSLPDRATAPAWKQRWWPEKERRRRKKSPLQRSAVRLLLTCPCCDTEHAPRDVLEHAATRLTSAPLAPSAAAHVCKLPHAEILPGKQQPRLKVQCGQFLRRSGI